MPRPSLTRAFRAFLFTISLAGVVGTFHSQEALQNPNEFLGYDLGDRFSLHHEVTDFSKHVGAQPGASYVEYGSTYEQRPLQAILFTHPNNLDRLEDIRLQHLDRVNGGTGKAEFDELAVVWMSYNVHGNEAVCTEAALEVMHALAEKCAAGDPMMKRLVVLVDPCLNPDGHDRYTVWFNQHASFPPNANPDGMEHDEPWPGGRPNHYLFDLNRDWAWQKQQETQKRSALYHAWMPHVHCDYHEMGYNSPYYFAPAAEPYHKAITDWQREFQEKIGQATATKFDARGELYYTRESFDLLYPSYGDTYPMYNGAIGMTYEQGGSGRAGVLVERADGKLLSLRERIDNHVESSLSAIETSARLAGRLVDELADFHETNRTQPLGRFGGYYIPVDAANASRVDRLVEFLERHEIECERATSTSRPMSAWEYGANTNRNVVIKPGDLLISSYQTHSRILDVLFDPDPALTDSLTYDITTWSVPYAYGLQTFGLSKPVQGGDWYQAQVLPNWAPSSYGYAIVPDQDGYTHALANFTKQASASELLRRPSCIPTLLTPEVHCSFCAATNQMSPGPTPCNPSERNRTSKLYPWKADTPLRGLTWVQITSGWWRHHTWPYSPVTKRQAWDRVRCGGTSSGNSSTLSPELIRRRLAPPNGAILMWWSCLPAGTVLHRNRGWRN